MPKEKRIVKKGEIIFIVICAIAIPSVFFIMPLMEEVSLDQMLCELTPTIKNKINNLEKLGETPEIIDYLNLKSLIKNRLDKAGYDPLSIVTDDNPEYKILTESKFRTKLREVVVRIQNENYKEDEIELLDKIKILIEKILIKTQPKEI